MRISARARRAPRARQARAAHGARWALAILALVATTSLGPVRAHAYSCESSISPGCHEGIAFRVMRALRQDRLALPLSATDDAEALLETPPFDIPRDMRDLAALAFVLGNRDNDFKGRDATDATALAGVHADPDGQAEHCLRAPGDDEPHGSERAVAACRQYIRERVTEALEGLDAAGAPTVERRTTIEVYAPFSGRRPIELPLYYVRMGQATHALQDSFSHAYRTDGHESIRTLVNYVDTTDHSEFDEHEDGPPHAGRMDSCEGLDAFRRERLDTATRATYELLYATLATAPPERDRAIDAVLDRYVAFAPGCGPDNNWCDAREIAYRDESACACSVVGATPRSGAIGWLGALGAGVLALFRRRNRRVESSARLRRLRALRIALLAFGAWTVSEHPALAQTSTDPSTARLKRVVLHPETDSAFRLALGAGGSLDNTALAFGGGVRYALSDRWILGVGSEWNPWATLHTTELRPGTLNAFGTIVRRWGVGFDHVWLRSTLHLGASFLLFDIVGAPRGSVGPYGGLNLLGLEVALSRDLAIVIDPADVRLPVPQLAGTPIAYLQYRFSVGIEFDIQPGRVPEPTRPLDAIGARWPAADQGRRMR